MVSCNQLHESGNPSRTNAKKRPTATVAATATMCCPHSPEIPLAASSDVPADKRLTERQTGFVRRQHLHMHKARAGAGGKWQKTVMPKVARGRGSCGLVHVGRCI